jgi:exonuclease VII large subunit
MKKLAALTLSLFLTTGIALADSPKDAEPKPAKAAEPAKPKASKKAEKSDSAIAAEIEELRQAIQSQQEQLQLLKEELAKRDRQIDENANGWLTC